MDRDFNIKNLRGRSSSQALRHWIGHPFRAVGILPTTLLGPTSTPAPANQTPPPRQLPLAFDISSRHPRTMSGGWNTIESDAVCLLPPLRCSHKLTNSQGVFTYLIEKLGVKDVQFEELVTLDSDELKRLGKIYGVIFLFKYPTGEERSDTPKDGVFDHDAANSIFFAAQTIQNACGTQALLSVLLNKDGEVQIGKDLREFKEFTQEFPPEVSMRGDREMEG